MQQRMHCIPAAFRTVGQALDRREGHEKLSESLGKEDSSFSLQLDLHLPSVPRRFHRALPALEMEQGRPSERGLGSQASSRRGHNSEVPEVDGYLFSHRRTKGAVRGDGNTLEVHWENQPFVPIFRLYPVRELISKTGTWSAPAKAETFIDSAAPMEPSSILIHASRIALDCRLYRYSFFVRRKSMASCLDDNGEIQISGLSSNQSVPLRSSIFIETASAHVTFCSPLTGC